MKIKLITVGRPKNYSLSELTQDYIGRISRFAEIEVVIVKAYTNERNQSSSSIVKKEGVEIMAKISPEEYIISLDKAGKSFNTEQFKKNLYNIQSQARVNFVIGGTYGLSTNVIEKSDQVISLSKLTFTHELAKVILLEQIYRGFMLLNSFPYHY